MITLRNFKGINNASDINKIPDGYLRECVDFDINANGLLTQRAGRVSKDTATYNCIGGDDKRCFAVRNSNLVEVTESAGIYSFTTIKASIGAVDLDFAECDGNYYYVGSTVNGVVKGSTNKSFGLPSVATQPTLTESNTGSLTKGVYLVACTFLDSSGLESGTVAPSSITISADGKKISLSNIPVSANADVTTVAIYVSTRNGSELYRQTTVNNYVTTATISSITPHTSALMTIGINPAPFGSLIGYHYSHLYIANGSYLFYCEKFRYHHWKPDNHYKLPSTITGIMSCETGLWIATLDGLYWISGRTPKHGFDGQSDFINAKKSDAVMKKGGEQKIPAEYLGTGTHGYVATTDQGIFILADGGQFVNSTVDTINMPVFTSNISAVVDGGDSLQYLGIITGSAVGARTI
jgi:ligand-binding sensor domain-containing protein